MSKLDNFQICPHCRGAGGGVGWKELRLPCARCSVCGGAGYIDENTLNEIHMREKYFEKLRLAEFFAFNKNKSMPADVERLRETAFHLTCFLKEAVQPTVCKYSKIIKGFFSTKWSCGRIVNEGDLCKTPSTIKETCISYLKMTHNIDDETAINCLNYLKESKLISVYDCEAIFFSIVGLIKL